MRRDRIARLIVLAGLLLLAGWLGRASALDAWMRATTGVMMESGGGAAFTGQPARLVSVTGHRTIRGEAETAPRVGAYHVLAIFSADSLHDVSSSIGPNATSDVWQAWSGPPGTRHAVQRSLETEYGAARQSARIGGHRYPLAHGNVFVARYDAQGRPAVTQLRRAIRDTDPRGAVRVYPSLLPGAPVVRDLLRYPGQPCPKYRASGASASNT